MTAPRAIPPSRRLNYPAPCPSCGGMTLWEAVNWIGSEATAAVPVGKCCPEVTG